MNSKEKISHILNSILKAETQQSKLDFKTLNLEGFSSYKIRHFLNNLLEIPNTNYLEVGTFKGSTFAAALYKNNINDAYAIDNFTEFEEYGEIKKDFLRATKDFKFTFLEEDCFSLDLNKIKNKINIYLYDGRHLYEDQYKALEYFYPILEDEFIFLVDDFDPYDENWEVVEKGTRDAIKDLKLKTLFQMHLKSTGRNAMDSWWNGYYVSILKK